MAGLLDERDQILALLDLLHAKADNINAWASQIAQHMENTAELARAVGERLNMLGEMMDELALLQLEAEDQTPGIVRYLDTRRSA